ncbi:MAG: hypothetical protein IBX55_21860 [Methyloprofundus sp.]|nr:hypothetical protein [Methyloprofundus sp.]
MTKRGAHITIIFSKGKMIGVQNKIKQFASAFNKQNFDVIVLNRDIDGCFDGVSYINYEDKYPGWSARFIRYYLVSKLIKLDKYHRLIIRYPLFDFSWFSISSHIKKVYFEHHTMELEELKKSGLNFFAKNIQYLAEKYFSPYFFKKCGGHLSVTSQISGYQKSRFGANKEYIVFSNGFNPEFYKKYAKKHEQESTQSKSGIFKIVYIASEFKEWHGLDRLLNAAQDYCGNQIIEVNLIGMLSPEQVASLQGIKKINVTFKLHGKLSHIESLQIINECDLGIDSLALDRLGFTVSSTLKSKEYIALGKPFISLTPDQDLIEFENKLWFKPSLRNETFDFLEVVNWFNSIDQLKINLESLSWNCKVRKLICIVG